MRSQKFFFCELIEMFSTFCSSKTWTPQRINFCHHLLFVPLHGYFIARCACFKQLGSGPPVVCMTGKAFWSIGLSLGCRLNRHPQTYLLKFDNWARPLSVFKIFTSNCKWNVHLYYIGRYLDRIIKSHELNEFSELILPHQKDVTSDGKCWTVKKFVQILALFSKGGCISFCNGNITVWSLIHPATCWTYSIDKSSCF